MFPQAMFHYPFLSLTKKNEKNENENKKKRRKLEPFGRFAMKRNRKEGREKRKEGREKRKEDPQK